MLARAMSLILVGGMFLVTSGCATLGDGDKTMKGAGIGTAGGAGIGALLGLAAGNPAKGAWIGAASGAALGTTVGFVLDSQEEKFRKLGLETKRLSDDRLLVQLSSGHLNFHTGSAALNPDGRRRLQQIAGVLREHPAPALTISGHTDNTGSRAFNHALSFQRAHRVREVLVSGGVDPQSIVAAGYGAQFPIAPNETAQGRALNRRVELTMSGRNAGRN